MDWPLRYVTVCVVQIQDTDICIIVCQNAQYLHYYPITTTSPLYGLTIVVCYCPSSPNSGHRCLYNCLPKCPISTLIVGSWWSQWGVIAAHQCYPSWGWWFDSLWVTLVRLWPHLFHVLTSKCYIEFSLQISSLWIFCGSRTLRMQIWKFWCF
jgi:hypothetical protein